MMDRVCVAAKSRLVYVVNVVPLKIFMLGIKFFFSYVSARQDNDPYLLIISSVKYLFFVYLQLNCRTSFLRLTLPQQLLRKLILVNCEYKLLTLGLFYHLYCASTFQNRNLRHNKYCWYIHNNLVLWRR